jgi:hypothetical protein
MRASRSALDALQQLASLLLQATSFYGQGGGLERPAGGFSPCAMTCQQP